MGTKKSDKTREITDSSALSSGRRTRRNTRAAAEPEDAAEAMPQTRSGGMRGLRKAEQFGRMINRLSEKFPLTKETAHEYLQLAAGLRGVAEALDYRCRFIGGMINPLRRSTAGGLMGAPAPAAEDEGDGDGDGEGQ